MIYFTSFINIKLGDWAQSPIPIKKYLYFKDNNLFNKKNNILKTSILLKNSKFI